MPVVLPMLSSRASVIYQQNNAHSHTARLSQQCLQGYDVLLWPARSSYLSPMKHIWDVLGRQLQPSGNIGELTAQLQRLWHDLPQEGQTLNSDIYCQQLDRLNLVTDQKRPELANMRGVVFHQDTARPHTFVVTHQKLWVLDWKVLMHPPYSPDLASNDSHLFLALQDFLSDKKLGSREDCKNQLLEFFANKGQDF
ncbi:histone-lysine N-methyltransferase SETMAR [Trichonephila clavipes]|nr:histone-lysine N-methyltransferase SETMAR [Trichonephila clavipes]